MLRRITVLLSILCILTTLFIGCGSSSEAQKTGKKDKGTVGTNAELMNDGKPRAAKSIKGAKLTVAVPGGLMAAYLHTSGMEWAKKNGVELTVMELPFGQLFEKLSTELIGKTGVYDVLLYPHYYTGDIISLGGCIPLESLIDGKTVDEPYEKGGLEWSSYYDAYKKIYSWYNGHIYTIPCDGDIFITSYRKDLFTNPEYASKFKAKYGYDLKVSPDFPETWDQYYDVAEFFNDIGKNKPDKERFYGTLDINRRGRASTWHFLTRYFTYLKKDGMFNGDVYFEKDTMTPMINNPAGVKAMEDLIKSATEKYSPPASAGYDWAELMNLWGQGNIAECFSWPALPATQRLDGAKLKLTDSAFAKIPGSKVVWDADKKQWIELDSVHRASPLAHGWQFSITDTCKSPEAAFDLIKWMSTGETLRQYTTGVGYEPCKKWEWEDPFIKDVYKDIPSFIEAMKGNLEVGVPELRIPGAIEMYDAIEIYKTKALEGKMTAKDAVDAIAADWTKIINSRGLEEMKKAYEATITPHDISEVVK